MFHSALIKLTLLYLIIIMAISVFFSTSLYQVSTNEIGRGMRRQQTIFEELGRPQGFLSNQEMIEEREKQISESNQRIFWQLLYTNIIILVAGGVISYLFARKTLRPIEEAHEAQSRFTADASHELRSPLAAIKTEIEVTLRGKEITASEARKILESNLEEIEKLSSLTNNLLELTRDNGNSLVREEISLKTVIESARKNISQEAKRKHIELEETIDPDFLVLGHKGSLIQLFTILLDNSIKYSENNKKIIISAERHGHFVVIKIKDEGFGIKGGDLVHIFDRFYRADLSRSKVNIEGYGLGLSIAKKIVDTHKGEIKVESEIGKGSVFTIKLPKATK